MNSAEHKNENIIWNLYPERLKPLEPLHSSKYKVLSETFEPQYNLCLIEPWCGTLSRTFEP